jgi:hypothetical protein
LCEDWWLRFKEEHGLIGLVNRALRGILGPKRNEVTEDRCKLHNGETYYLYFSSNIIRVIKSRRKRWEEDVARRRRGDTYTES